MAKAEKPKKRRTNLVKTYFEWLTPAETDALTRVVRKVTEGAEGAQHVCIREFPRFGKSGARLFLVYFDKAGRGKPFVVKLQGKEKSVSEYEACNAAKLVFTHDATQALNHTIGRPRKDSEAMGAILYAHVGAYSAADVEEVKELKKWVFNIKRPIEEVVSGLKRCYEHNIARAYSDSNRLVREIVLKDEYQSPRNYLRLEDKITNDGYTRMGTRALLKGALGRTREQEFELFGAHVYNPDTMLDRLLSDRMKATVGPIHGDLHTSNLLFDVDSQPKLIDFAWFNARGHLLKDYVLMENSVRFMDFPGNVIHPNEVDIDLKLAEEDGWKYLHTLECGDDRLDEHVRRVGALVGVIRESAKASLREYWEFREYLTAQFLVLVGQLGHYDYNFRESVRCLGIIARQLK